MIPESIPEDKKQSFPCPDCDNGSVSKNEEDFWECDSCNFSKIQEMDS